MNQTADSNSQTVQNEVIDLRELFSVLKKRKKLIWSMTILITILSIVYAFFIAKPVYSVKSIIEVGEINNKPIDDINTIQEKLSYIYKVNAKGIKRELPLVKSISAAKFSKIILSIIIHGKNNEEAVAYTQKVISKIETQYKEKTDAYTNSQKELIKLIQTGIKENTTSLEQMKEDLGNYSQKIISLKSEDAALAGIYALQIGQKQTQLQNLKKYISKLKNEEQVLKLSITPLMMKPTHVVGEIEILEKPIKPKKQLIVIVAFITGLMLAIFLAFFLEFLRGRKEEEKDA